MLALLKACFNREQVLHRSRRVLLPKLYAAAVEFGRCLDRGEVEDPGGDSLLTNTPLPAPKGFARAVAPTTAAGAQRSIEAALPANASANEIISCIHKFNADPQVDGISLQQPVPGESEIQRESNLLTAMLSLLTFFSLYPLFLCQAI